MLKYQPKPLNPTTTITTVPGDKSISHRSIILASLTKQDIKIEKCLMSTDCLNTINIFQQLGVSINYQKQTGCVDINGVGLHGLKAPKTQLNVGNSGTAIRLISGILAGQSFNSTLTGDASIQTRPMKRIILPLTQMGAKITGNDLHNEKCPPLHITGTALQGITYELPIASAQVKSCILLAGLFANGKTTVIETKATRDHTEIMLKGMGVDIKQIPLKSQGRSITVIPPKTLSYRNHQTLTIPADFSSAAFLIVLALITKIDLTLHNINLNPTRSSLLNVLEGFGIPVKETSDITEFFDGILIKRSASTLGEPAGDIRINITNTLLKNGTVPTELIPLIIDEIPILAIYGLFALGTLTVAEAEELRVKESDRIATIVAMISKLGGNITETSAGFYLQGNPDHTVSDHVCIDPKFDHRIAMAAIIASVASQTPIQLLDSECIETSFPNFMDIIQQLYRT